MATHSCTLARSARCSSSRSAAKRLRRFITPVSSSWWASRSTLAVSSASSRPRALRRLVIWRLKLPISTQRHSVITKKTKLITCSARVLLGMCSGVPTTASTPAVHVAAMAHAMIERSGSSDRVRVQYTMKSSRANMKLTSGTQAMQASCSACAGMVW